MENELFTQIYDNMKLKSDSELLEIWVSDDHESWSEDAFKAVELILKERNLSIPLKMEKLEKEEMNPIDSEIVDQSLIYNPNEALNLIRVLEKGIYFVFASIIVVSLGELPRLYKPVSSFFINSTLSYMIPLSISIFILIIGIAITCFFYYLLFKYSTVALKILYSMELVSRQGLKGNKN
jgi:hypothetical protein